MRASAVDPPMKGVELGAMKGKSESNVRICLKEREKGRDTAVKV